MVIGMELGKTSVEKILEPVAVRLSAVTLLILAASVAVKLWLWRFNIRLGRHIGSQALLATAADSPRHFWAFELVEDFYRRLVTVKAGVRIGRIPVVAVLRTTQR